jgi:hypothetical protein
MREGRHIIRCLSRSLLLLAACLPFLVAAEQADLPGLYQGNAPPSDPARRSFTLDLSADGSAAWTTRYIGKGDVVEHGMWTRQGNQVTLTLDPMGPNRPPAPIVFRRRGHTLDPVHWDASEWGRMGPPVLHRANTGKGQGGA